MSTIYEGRNRVTNIYTGTRQHGGIDIVGDDNPTVRSVTEGEVYLVNFWDGKTKTGTQSYGNIVIVVSEGMRFYYAHLASIAVEKGQIIGIGETIGIMGSTGNTTGAHTHFEARTGIRIATRINPAPFCGVENAIGTYFEPQPLFGDVDGDGQITANDARLILLAAAGIGTLSSIQRQVIGLSEGERPTAAIARDILKRAT